eukprot:4318424-Pyramimonas_sp.AAC.1
MPASRSIRSALAAGAPGSWNRLSTMFAGHHIPHRDHTCCASDMMAVATKRLSEKASVCLLHLLLLLLSYPRPPSS